MNHQHTPKEPEVVDWQRVPLPSQELEVLYRRVQDVALVLLVLIMAGPLTLSILTSPKLKPMSLVVAVIVAVPLLTVGFLRVRSKRKAVRRFDAAGVHRGDGQLLKWADFCGCLRKTTRRTPSGPELLWRAELLFAGGETAWLIPEQIKNGEEVFDYAYALPQAKTK